MSSGNIKKSKTLRALERVKQAHVLDARQTYSDASVIADCADREYQESVASARQLEESVRASSREGVAISVGTWELARRYLVQTHELSTQYALVRDRAVQKQDQVGEKMKDAMVEQKIVQHHAEKIDALVSREQFSLAARESDELWLLRRHNNDTN